tara:strand:+ start:2484 stop:3320 length:837 start_codon:yes stop_codon:yes gene_type:complete
MTEKSLDYYKKKGHYNPIEAERLGVPLRVSKSSFMQYLWCPRQFWWNHVMLPDVRPPPTEAMLRGTEVHDALDEAYDNWEGEDLPLPVSDDAAYITLIEMENQRRQLWGEEHFIPIEHEIHHEVYDPELNIVMVGRMDALYRHPDGGLVLGELKTGNMGDSKLSKTRKELCFYMRMLQLMGVEEEVTHFYYMTPDCDNATFVQKILEKKKPPVTFMGETQGLAILEPVSKRSINAFTKSLRVAIDGLRGQEWPMKWNDFTCPQWCDYSISCDNERLGI